MIARNPLQVLIEYVDATPEAFEQPSLDLRLIHHMPASLKEDAKADLFAIDATRKQCHRSDALTIVRRCYLMPETHDTHSDAVTDVRLEISKCTGESCRSRLPAFAIESLKKLATPFIGYEDSGRGFEDDYRKGHVLDNICDKVGVDPRRKCKEETQNGTAVLVAGLIMQFDAHL